MGFDLIKGIAHRWIVSLASLGEFGFPRIAAEELNVEAVFQQFNLMAYSRAGYAKFARGHAERAETSGGLKGS